MIEEIFKVLKENIGNTLKCTYISGNSEKVVEAELKDVIDYKAIIIGHITLPFLGLSVAIKRIETINNEVLFNNNSIENEYINETPEELDERKKKLFGDDYLEKYHNYIYNKYTTRKKSSK